MRTMVLSKSARRSPASIVGVLLLACQSMVAAQARTLGSPVTSETAVQQPCYGADGLAGKGDPRPELRQAQTFLTQN